MDIKQEDVPSDSQNETEFFIKNVTDSDSNITIKTEVKSENVLQDFTSQKEREFVPEDPVMKYDIDHAIHHKVEIKEEPYWLETDTSSVYEDIKDEELLPVKSARLCVEAVSGEDLGTECESDEIPTVEQHIPSDGQTFINRAQYLKQNNSHKCGSCDKSFTYLSHFKKHILIHEGKKPHKCDICEKGFTQLSSLQRHDLLHQGKKPHKCQICDKSFTQLSHLKMHELVHQGKKPHKCKICGKQFADLSNLKQHNLIHEGKKPHKCAICDKSFTHLSHLKTHNLIHEGKKPHKCKTCERGFTQLSTLKRHCLIHEGKKPYTCYTCDKNFTSLSYLKKHNLMHVIKEPC